MKLQVPTVHTREIVGTSISFIPEDVKLNSVRENEK